jgi:hypothetical protein
MILKFATFKEVNFTKKFYKVQGVFEMSNAIHVTDADFDSVVLKSDIPV